MLISNTEGSEDTVDQDHTAQNLRSDLRSTLSDKEIFLTLNNFEIAILWFCVVAFNAVK